MDDETRNLLADEQIDVDGALERVAGNEALLIRLLKKFADNDYYEQVRGALDQGDLKAAQERLHSMKGVTANLGINSLFELSKDACAQAGEGRVPTNMEELETTYRSVIRALRALP